MAGTARGYYVVRGAVSANATTAIFGNPESTSGQATAYLLKLALYVTTAGSAWQGVYQSHNTSAVVGVGTLNVVGVALDDDCIVPGQPAPIPGIPLPFGEGLDLVTSGTTPGTVNYEVVYVVR